MRLYLLIPLLGGFAISAFVLFIVLALSSGYGLRDHLVMPGIIAGGQLVSFSAWAVIRWCSVRPNGSALATPKPGATPPSTNASALRNLFLLLCGLPGSIVVSLIVSVAVVPFRGAGHGTELGTTRYDNAYIFQPVGGLAMALIGWSIAIVAIRTRRARYPAIGTAIGCTAIGVLYWLTI